MSAASSWSIEETSSYFWRRQPQRWKVKRKRLVDVLAMNQSKAPAAMPSQSSALIDFPPKPILQIRIWVGWASKQVQLYVRSLADETKVLVTQLTNSDAPVNPDRAWEVDLLRGVTIILMVLIHMIPMTASMTFLWIPLVSLRLLFYFFVGIAIAFFGLSMSNSDEANGTTSFAKWGRRGLDTLALLIAWFFIHGTQSRFLIEMFAGIMGISLLLGYENRRRRTSQAQSFRQQVSRALPLIIQGTSLAFVFSFFGPMAGGLPALLAMLGLSQILAYPFLSRTRWLSFTVGLAAIVLASVPLIAALTPNLVNILVLGASIGVGAYSSFLPWFGATLLGIFIGKTLYRQGERRFALPDVSQTTPCRQLIVIGQHAHLIFLLHLPLAVTWVPLKNNVYLAAVQASKWPYPFRFV